MTLIGSTQAVREAGITYRQLDHWARLGYLRPVQAGGSGNAREWTRAEVNIARLMGRLVRAGVAVETAALFARASQARSEIAPGVWLEVA
jgi:DNA-binding transcriptional MerR regulator